MPATWSASAPWQSSATEHSGSPGDNSYAGGTAVQAGVLIGNTASLPGNILNNATVVFDQPNDGTYAGAMTGTGKLIKTGPGKLHLIGSSSIGGGTTLEAGRLTVNGSLTSNITSMAAR